MWMFQVLGKKVVAGCVTVAAVPQGISLKMNGKGCIFSVASDLV